MSFVTSVGQDVLVPGRWEVMGALQVRLGGWGGSVDSCPGEGALYYVNCSGKVPLGGCPILGGNKYRRI